MILDKLIEKKDLKAYINLRIKTLRIEYHKAMSYSDRRKREFIRRQLRGRILELRQLLKNLDIIKTESKKLWQRLYGKDISRHPNL